MTSAFSKGKADPFFTQKVDRAFFDSDGSYNLAAFSTFLVPSKIEKARKLCTNDRYDSFVTL